MEKNEKECTFSVIAERGKRLPLKAADSRLFNLWTIGMACSVCVCVCIVRSYIRSDRTFAALKEDIEALCKEECSPTPNGEHAPGQYSPATVHQMTKKVLGGTSRSQAFQFVETERSISRM